MILAVSHSAATVHVDSITAALDGMTRFGIICIRQQGVPRN
jgi:hypothetical protein